MEESKFYTPQIEDLYVGYECEACFSSYGGYMIFDMEDPSKSVLHEPEDKEAARFWSKFYLIEKESTHTDNNQRDHKTTIELLKNGQLRTKYLDQTDIESLGWKDIENLQQDSYTGYKASCKRGLYPETLNLLWWSNDKLKISSNMLGTMFWGNCKSINELRKIQQWLEISYPPRL